MTSGETLRKRIRPGSPPSPPPPKVVSTKGDKGDKGDAGDKGDPGDTGAQGSGADLSVTASEHIPAFSPVISTGFKANSSNLAHFSKVIGISKAAINSGFSGPVTGIGEIQNLAWSWTAGDIVFLNGLGLLTIPPTSGFVQKIAVAKNSTTLIVELEPPILL